MKKLATKIMTGMCGGLAGAAMLLSVSTVSSAQQVTDASFVGSVTIQAVADFVQGAYLEVGYQVFGTSTAASSDGKMVQKTALNFKSMPGQPAVMTCSIEGWGHNSVKDCNGSQKTVGHALMGQSSFVSEIELSKEDLAGFQKSSGANNIEISVSYI